MVRLVAVAQAAQDLHGLVDRRLLDAHLLEAALERGVALEVLAVLVERRRADRLDLTASERRLEDRGSVDRALGGAGADEVVQLVDEEDDVAALGISFITVFRRSSNSPRYFVPATSAARSSV